MSFYKHIILIASVLFLGFGTTYAVELDTFKINANGPLEFCEGGNVILSAPLECDSYIWNTGERSPSIKVRSSGTYFVTVFNHKGNGISLTSDPVEVIVHKALKVNIISSCAPIICAGDSLVLYAVSDKNYSYKWNTGSVGNLLVVKNAGKFSVTVTDNFGCTGFAEIDVKVYAKNKSYITSSGNKNKIANGETIRLSAYPEGIRYKWSTGDTSQTIDIKGFGRYCVVTYIDCDKPCKDTICINISKKDFSDIKITPSKDPNKNNGRDTLVNNGRDTILTNPDNPTKKDTIKFNSPTNKQLILCNGDSIFLIATSGFDKYQWNTGERTRIIKVNSAGKYSVVGLNNDGFSATDTFEVTFITLQKITINQVGNSTICNGETVTLQAQSGFQGYKWNTGDTTQSIIVKRTGNYKVTAYVGNCEVSSESISINVLPKLDYTISNPIPIRVCLNTNNSISIIIKNKNSISQKFKIKDISNDRFWVNVQDVSVPSNSETTIVSGFDATNAELNRTYNSNFVIIDECGNEQIVNLAATVYDFDLNINLINQDTVSKRPGNDRKIFITTNNLMNQKPNASFFGLNDTITIFLKYENTTLEIKEIFDYCGGNNFTHNKKTGTSEIKFYGGCGSIPDTLATLVFETAIGQTLMPELKITNIKANNKCLNFSTKPIIIPLLPYDCEIKTLNIKYNPPILKNVALLNNNTIRINFTLQTPSNLDLYISDMYGDKYFLFKNQFFNSGDIEILKRTQQFSSGLYFLNIHNNFGNSTLPIYFYK